MNETPMIVHDKDGLLGVVPLLFGFSPRESIIVVATHGERRRFGFRLRADLDGLDGERLFDGAMEVNRHVERQDNVDGIIIIGISDDPLRAQVAVDAVKATATLPVIDTTVGPNNPLPSGEAMTRADGESVPMFPSREAMAKLYLPSEVPFVSEVAGCTGYPNLWQDSFNTLLASDGSDLRAYDIANLRECAADITYRDEAWLSMTRENAEAHSEVWRKVAVYTNTVGAYALTAFACWLYGDGSRALVAMERADLIDPDYSMTTLLRVMLDNAVSPKNWGGFKA